MSQLNEFEKSENRNINIIRYLLCLPAGIAGYYVSKFFVYYISYFNNFMFGDNWVQDYIPFLYDFSIDTQLSHFSGLVYLCAIYCVYHVIPDFKRVAGFLISGYLFIDTSLKIYLSFFSITIGVTQINVNNLDYSSSISELIGISAAIYVVYNKKHLIK